MATVDGAVNVTVDGTAPSASDDGCMANPDLLTGLTISTFKRWSP